MSFINDTNCCHSNNLMANGSYSILRRYTKHTHYGASSQARYLYVKKFNELHHTDDFTCTERTRPTTRWTRMLLPSEIAHAACVPLRVRTSCSSQERENDSRASNGGNPEWEKRNPRKHWHLWLWSKLGKGINYLSWTAHY